ncbi:MAG TPA: hypothetical protein VGE52_07505 [Pirellulales bacterium]
MLTGERATEFAAAQRMKAGLLAIFLLPFLLMGMSFLTVGVFSLRDPVRFEGMWIGLPIGVLLLLGTALVFHILLNVIPGRTVASFEFDGELLKLRTLQDRVVEQRADATEMIVESRTPRRRRLRGWWLTFRSAGRRTSLFLERETSQSQELVNQLRQRLEAKRG